MIQYSLLQKQKEWLHNMLLKCYSNVLHILIFKEQCYNTSNCIIIQLSILKFLFRNPIVLIDLLDLSQQIGSFLRFVR